MDPQSTYTKPVPTARSSTFPPPSSVFTLTTRPQSQFNPRSTLNPSLSPCLSVIYFLRACSSYHPYHLYLLSSPRVHCPTTYIIPLSLLPASYSPSFHPISSSISLYILYYSLKILLSFPHLHTRHPLINFHLNHMPHVHVAPSIYTSTDNPHYQPLP